MATYEVAITWEMSAVVKVEADFPDEVEAKVLDLDLVEAPTTGGYIDQSMRVDVGRNWGDWKKGVRLIDDKEKEP